MRSRKRWDFRYSVLDAMKAGIDLGPKITPLVELCVYADAMPMGHPQTTMLWEGAVPDSATNHYMRMSLIYLTLRNQAKKGKVTNALVDLAYQRMCRDVNKMHDAGTDNIYVDDCLDKHIIHFSQWCRSVGYLEGLNPARGILPRGLMGLQGQ
ncbi:hypothetical protein RQP46_000087 [Phenoliferia psychrophenolica]